MKLLTEQELTLTRKANLKIAVTHYWLFLSEWENIKKKPELGSPDLLLQTFLKKLLELIEQNSIAFFYECSIKHILPLLANEEGINEQVIISSCKGFLRSSSELIENKELLNRILDFDYFAYKIAKKLLRLTKNEASYSTRKNRTL